MEYTCVTIADHSYYLAASSTGLCFVGSPDGIFQELVSFYPRATLTPTTSNSILLVAQAQLDAYFKKATQNFNVPLDFTVGTAFQQTVWQQLTQIPYGQTLSYQELATRLAQPNASRAVASAVAKNPLLIIVPCHRIIRADGSLGDFRAGKAFKQQLLELEQADLNSK